MNFKLNKYLESNKEISKKLHNPLKIHNLIIKTKIEKSMSQLNSRTKNCQTFLTVLRIKNIQ